MYTLPVVLCFPVKKDNVDMESRFRYMYMYMYDLNNLNVYTDYQAKSLQTVTSNGMFFEERPNNSFNIMTFYLIIRSVAKVLVHFILLICQLCALGL